ncbi:tyrosine-type recombinase/integrase [Salmonella enterica subsp. enterica serovar Tennessee]|nr:tyrosine-type recombinase/integrase [Salmonella enterica subsp. enterica serovar Tennessee]
MAAENKLSDKKIKCLYGKPLDKQKVISDGRGLSVRVSKNGAVSFVFFYRLGGRDTAPVWLTLGKYPDMSLKMARESRDKCRTWLAGGIDPRHRIGFVTDESKRPVTVKDALEYWIEHHVKVKRKRHDDCTYRFERYIYPRVGNLPLSECTAVRWIECFDDIKKKAPASSGLTFMDVKQALKFCRIRRFAHSSELDDFSITDMGEKARKKERFLTMDELRDVWTFANIEIGNKLFTPNDRVLVKIMLVFGCRTKELRLSTWDEWDFKQWIWTVPAEHSKNGREIIRPIPPQIRHWLVTINAIAEMEKRKSVLPNGDAGQASTAVMGCRIHKKLRHEKPWSLHDFRRTISTNLNEFGENPYVVEQLLGHALPGVMGIYNRSNYIEEKMKVLSNWCNHLNSLLKLNEVAA